MTTPARKVHASVKPTGLNVEPTGVVEISIEALRDLCAKAGVTLIEHPEEDR